MQIPRWAKKIRIIKVLMSKEFSLAGSEGYVIKNKIYRNQFPV